jgi:hypothetical protein
VIRPNQIPDEVVEAALEAFTHASGLGLFPDEDEEWREDLVNGMRATIAAALSAWPGAFPWTFNGPLEGTGFVLPIVVGKNEE